MFDAGEKIDNSFTFIRKRFLIVILICIVSSLLCIFYAPSYISENFTPDIIDSQLSLYFGGSIGIGSKEVLAALLWMFQSMMISTFLLIISYIFKYDMTKRIFNIKKWNDWKLFIFASVAPLIIVDLIGRTNAYTGFSTSLFSNVVLTIIASFLVILISSFIIEKEKDPIIIDVKKIEEELMSQE
ncbi:MAG: hypothetical protein PHW52_00525 [Candidatus Pacebacteria bacterium]|nr:hypothetical protein [Candidatus Paceibacterota bacterium]